MCLSRSRRTIRESGASPSPSLDKRLDLIPDNDFRAINHPPAGQVPASRYAQLRRQSPSKRERESVNAGDGEKLDPVYGYKVDRLQADHVVSLHEIAQVPGFAQLTNPSQLEFANWLFNMMGLGNRSNASKGAKSWAQWPGHRELGPIDPDLRSRMIQREQELREAFKSEVLMRFRSENK